jgi:hypothetical protein
LSFSLSSSLSLSLSLSVSLSPLSFNLSIFLSPQRSKTQCREQEQQNEFWKHLGYPELTKICRHRNSDFCLKPEQLTHYTNWEKLQLIQVSSPHHLPWRIPLSPVQHVGTDCTPPGQRCWPNKWSEISCPSWWEKGSSASAAWGK